MSVSIVDIKKDVMPESNVIVDVIKIGLILRGRL